MISATATARKAIAFPAIRRKSWVAVMEQMLHAKK